MNALQAAQKARREAKRLRDQSRDATRVGKHDKAADLLELAGGYDKKAAAWQRQWDQGDRDQV